MSDTARVHEFMLMWPAEPDAGLSSGYEKVTILYQSPGADKADMDEERDELNRMLSELHDCACMPLEEWQKIEHEYATADHEMYMDWVEAQRVFRCKLGCPSAYIRIDPDGCTSRVMEDGTWVSMGRRTVKQVLDLNYVDREVADTRHAARLIDSTKYSNIHNQEASKDD